MPKHKLNKSQMIKVVKLYQHITKKSKVNIFGPADKLGRNIKQCIRAKDANKKYLNNITEDPPHLFQYEIAFMHHHGYFPTDKYRITHNLQISHVCGKPELKKKSKYDKYDQQDRIVPSSCIEGSHLVLESMDENILRRTCHKYIRLFQQAYKNRQTQFLSTLGTLKVWSINKIVPYNNPFKGFKKHHQCKCNQQLCFINYGKLRD